MNTLSSREQRILDFLEKYVAKNGHAPTYEIVAHSLGYAGKSSVQAHMESLTQKGFIKKGEKLSNSLIINRTINAIPLLGKVAAGRPLDHKKFDEEIEVPPSMIKGSGSYFALQVAGDSMIGEGILEDDLVVIRKQAVANNGDIVVAEIDDEATIKRFYKKKNHIELHSANPKYKPIIVNDNTLLKIAGILLGVIRHYKS